LDSLAADVQDTVTEPRTEVRASAAPRPTWMADWHRVTREPGLAVGLAISIVAVGLHIPVLVTQYGRADDYRSLYQSRVFRLDEAWDLGMAGGRPISAIGWTYLISLVDSVAGLAWLRLLALLAVAVSAGVIAWWAVRLSGRTGRAAWAVGVLPGALLVAVPGAQTIVTWAVLAVQAWALPAALIAGILLERSARTDLDRRSHRGLVFLWAGLLVLFSAFTYQQYAALVLFPPLIGAAIRFARRQRVDLVPTLFAGIATTLALAANYTFVLGMGSEVAARATQRSSVTAILDWFATVYLPRTIGLEVPDTPGTTAACGAVLLALLAIPAIRGPRYLAASAAVLVCWLAVAMPMAAVGELWASYRVVYPPQIVLWSGAVLVAGLALLEPGRPVADPRLTRVHTPAMASTLVTVVALTAGAIGASRAYFYYAVPNANDWRSARCVAADLSSGIGGDDVIRVQPWSAARSRVILGDEPGIIAGAIDWAVGNMLWLATEDVGTPPRFDPSRVRVIGPDDAAPSGRRIVTVAQDACEAATR
jgi:hypothetical protein